MEDAIGISPRAMRICAPVSEDSLLANLSFQKIADRHRAGYFPVDASDEKSRSCSMNRIEPETVSERAEDVERLLFGLFSQDGRTPAGDLKKDLEVFVVRGMDADRPPQKRIRLIIDADHEKLPWFCLFGYLRRFQPEQKIIAPALLEDNLGPRVLHHERTRFENKNNKILEI